MEEETPQRSNEMTFIITPASNSITPTPSINDELDEDFDDRFDDESDLMSFYNFSKLHFQNRENHKHTPQRLKKPLLHHEDEGDALVRRDKKTCPSCCPG